MGRVISLCPNGAINSLLVLNYWRKRITIRYGIERKNGSQTIVCTLVAYDFDKNIVGQFDDKFEPGNKRVQRDTPVATRSAPVSAALSNCRAA